MHIDAGSSKSCLLVPKEPGRVCVAAAGSVLCDVSSPVDTATRFRARIVIFNINFPITKGFPVSAVSVSVLRHFNLVCCMDLSLIHI